MRTFVALLAAPLLVSSMSVTALAQETGRISGTTPISTPEGRSTGDKARAVQDKFAVCIVRRGYVKVVKALAGPQSYEDDYEALPKLMDKRCFFGGDGVGQLGGTERVELNTGPVTFRGSLFKALVLKDFSRRPVAFGPDAPPIEGDNGELVKYADCVVRRDPETSMTLFKATAGTSAETAALAALSPHVQGCKVPSGLSSQKAVLIGYLAEAYYREAEAAGKTSEG